MQVAADRQRYIVVVVDCRCWPAAAVGSGGNDDGVGGRRDAVDAGKAADSQWSAGIADRSVDAGGERPDAIVRIVQDERCDVAAVVTAQQKVGTGERTSRR
jgi:hypothetical protein